MSFKHSSRFFNFLICLQLAVILGNWWDCIEAYVYLVFIKMGNQLLKGYTIQGEAKPGMGCEKIWKVYQGQKNSTQALATIFSI